MLRKMLVVIFVLGACYSGQFYLSGCAQILAPTGGPRDSIPPKLISASPPERTTNFTGNRINLNFDEYIQLDQLQENLIVSPTPKVNPLVDYKLRTVTIKLKDTLLPNTTYAINFGNAIKDLNEGNPFKRFTYVFSTGSFIDSLELSGKVIIAESGKADSTLQVYLYKNAPDSAVQKRRPDYITKLDSLGTFHFNYLPGGSYKVYAIKDGDGSKTYNSKSELFGFLDSNIIVSNASPNITLYAYAEEKEKPKGGGVIAKGKVPKDFKFRYTTTAPPDNQDILKPYVVTFNSPLKEYKKTDIALTDTLYNKIAIDSVVMDSTQKTMRLFVKWEEDNNYRLFLNKGAFTDTLGNNTVKTDTLKFKTKKKTEYGSLAIHFKHLDLSSHPVLQFVQNNEVVLSYPLTGADWLETLMNPSEYDVRVLYDLNNNGKWDPGNYVLKKQPEKVISINKRVTIRANFDNEIEVDL